MAPRTAALVFSAVPAAGVLLLAAAMWRISSAVAVIVVGAVLASLLGLLVWVALDLRTRLRRQGEQLAGVQKSLGAAERATEHRDSAARETWAAELQKVRNDAAKMQAAMKTYYRQTESLLNLHALVTVRAALPHTRGFAASPDVLLTYVDEILRRRPALVVECGSGVSTIWAAYALQACGSGRLVSLEHEPEYAERTRAALERHGLNAWADVRLAPTDDVVVDGEARRWYATPAIEDLMSIDMLFVDGPGPVAQFGEHARYPAGPLLGPRLAPGAFVLVDDTVRRQETEIAERWHREWDGSSLEFLPHEAGAAVLRLPLQRQMSTPLERR